eukprot:606801-Pelagomonas_calceolata.AAC.3
MHNSAWMNDRGHMHFKVACLQQCYRALEFETCRLRKTCLTSRGVNPIFHHPISIPDHPLHQIGSFLVIWSPCMKISSLQKKWSEKTQRLARNKISAFIKGGNPAQAQQGVPKRWSQGKAVGRFGVI